MEELRLLTDDEAVALVAQLSIELSESVGEQALDAAFADFDSDASPEVATFVREALTAPIGDAALSTTESIQAARTILGVLGQDAALGPIVRAKAQTFTNPEAGDPVISVGIAASLIFLMLSSYVRISYDKDAGLKVLIGKERIRDAKVVETVINPLAPVAQTAAKAMATVKASTK